jgi:Cd2+/Zn2+-exporting ATPase
MPVDKSPGDDLYAGTVNGSGVLTARVSRLSTDNTISRIIQMVEAAQAQRAPVQRWVDRFARIYTPAVVFVALAVAVLPPLLFGQPLLSQGGDTGWLYRSLALLVIACPCALVISTPVSIASAIAAAASQGVLIKGGAYLEAMAGVRAMAFDQTGTLTMGQPALTAFQCVNHVPPGNGATCPACDEVLALAAALERRSEHPLARAVVQGAESRHLQYPAAEGVQAVAGRGVWGRVNGLELGISSHRHAHELELCDAPEFCRAVFERETSGQTTMILHDTSALHGYLAVADQVRQESAAMAAALHAEGVERLVMLTGDNELTARAIGTRVGMDEIQAHLLPQEKVDAIRQLQRRYGSVAMVGDGVNDTPALAAADVGIAMGAAGTDQALETADIALMGDDLSKLPFTVQLSHSARSIIFQNIAFALIIKAVFMALAMIGVATLWMAVFADVGASLIVILNGMRLLRSRPDHGHASTTSPTAQRTAP